MPPFRVGADVGGTNTDFCVLDERSGRLRVHKLPSTVSDPSLGIEQGVRELVRRAGLEPREVGRFIQGTTVATNAILERKGARLALLTTKGFRDLLEIGRQKRPHLYDLQADKPPPLVPRDARYEVTERLDHKGDVVRKLDAGEVERLLDALEEKNPEGFAVVFLHSYVNPRHEEQARSLITKRFPRAFTSISSEISGEFREYERLIATILNAFVGPKMKAYLESFGNRLNAMGIARSYVNQSNGGIISVEEAARFPIHTALSGPAAGVVGARLVAALRKEPAVIPIDIGGTSADISLIREGRVPLSREREIGGYPLRTPALDITTIGAGGGSLAWVDSGGILKVGPRSAGAEPGPACYGRGGDEPTVTDARVVLGHLNPEYLLGGRLPISRDEAASAVARIAEAVGMSLEEAAAGILRVANATMVRAIHRVTVEQGYNPEAFTLLAFGGAGPLHAGELARELGIRRCLIPPHPGILAALGLLVEDSRKDFVRTRLTPLEPPEREAIEGAFGELGARAEAWLDSEGIPPERRSLLRSLDMRYRGQNYEIPVAFPAGPAWTVEGLQRAFRAEHEARYGHAAAEAEPVQIVNFRVTAIGATPSLELPKEAPGAADPSGAKVAERRALIDSEAAEPCPVYDRARLRPGNVIEGPAIVEQMDATTLILPGQSGRVDELRALIVEERSVR